MLIKKKICLNYKFPYKIVLIANFLYEATNKDNEYALLIKQKVVSAIIDLLPTR